MQVKCHLETVYPNESKNVNVNIFVLANNHNFNLAMAFVADLCPDKLFHLLSILRILYKCIIYFKPSYAYLFLLLSIFFAR